MSTLIYLLDAHLAADRPLPDTEALEVFWQNPEAVLDLVCGSRRVVGAVTEHDHDKNGGESLLLPILSHSFGSFDIAGVNTRGIPLFPPDTGTFAAVTTNGIVDRSGAKRLYSALAILPGGVKGVRCTIGESHAHTAVAVGLTVVFRLLGSVNYKLGVAPVEVRCELTWTTSLTYPLQSHSAEVADLSELGACEEDRFVEIALFLTSDPTVAGANRILDLEVLPRYFTSGCRAANSKDVAYPQLAARELKSGMGSFSAQLAAKIKAISNSLNVALWGSTPGLLADQTPDRRRRYREPIYGGHQHRGRLVPDGLGGCFGDGACLTDAQSVGLVYDLGISANTMNHNPHIGPTAHGGDITQYWAHFNFRRSIPAGLGALLFRFCAAPGIGALIATDPSRRLLVTMQIVPVGGSGDIVTRLYCGPYASPLEATDDDYGFCELAPEDDDAYRSNAELLIEGDKGWNRSAEIADASKRALGMHASTTTAPALYRLSQPLTAQLSYPVLRPSESQRSTQDFDIKIQLKQRNSAGAYDAFCGVMGWLCWSAPGY